MWLTQLQAKKKYRFWYARVAQWIEHAPSKREVAGSNPAVGAEFFFSGAGD